MPSYPPREQDQVCCLGLLATEGCDIVGNQTRKLPINALLLCDSGALNGRSI